MRALTDPAVNHHTPAHRAAIPRAAGGRVYARTRQPAPHLRRTPAMPLDVEEVPLRSATTAEWAASPANGLVLAAGELGMDLTTGEVRKGDGTHVWSALSTAGPRRGVTTLVAGTKVVSDPLVTANSRIQLTAQSLGTVTAPKSLAVTARTPGTSFTITSSDATDTSVVAYEIVEQ